MKRVICYVMLPMSESEIDHYYDVDNFAGQLTSELETHLANVAEVITEESERVITECEQMLRNDAS